jgi:hypothetical protein
MTSSAAPVAHARCTRRRPGRRDSGGALPVRWSVGYPDRPRMPAAGLRRPPSRSARTTWPLWGSSLRAPSVAGDLPPPHRQTGFPQPVATLLPPNRARQAYDLVARSLGRSVAPRQQHQPSLRGAASSSAEHGQIRRPIFVPRPGHTVIYSPCARAGPAPPQLYIKYMPCSGQQARGAGARDEKGQILFSPCWRGTASMHAHKSGAPFCGCTRVSCGRQAVAVLIEGKRTAVLG